MSRLRCYMSWLALDGMKSFADTRGQAALEEIKAAGFDGIQFDDPVDWNALRLAPQMGLGICGSSRVNAPLEAAPLAQAAADAGLECLTLHVGWGMEDDDEGARLIESILQASEQHRIPLYVETHRATIFQDMQRTVQFLKRFPELEFNGDFSHWYTGSEMVYGGFAHKLEFIQPVVERVRFLHGRIGNPGCMQVAITADDPAPYVAHFREMWTRCFVAYLGATEPKQKFIAFTPELLAPGIFYARTFQDTEESDRWEQSQLLLRIARECFQAAEQLRQ